MKTPAIAAIAVALFLGACAQPASIMGFALIMETEEPRMVTEASVASKRGEACATNIVGIIAQGNASIDAAKRNGGITQVTSVDSSVYSVLGLYAKVCTIVRGN